MATTTPVYGFRKPDPADRVNVTTDISDNMDLIEEAIAAVLDLSAYSGEAVSILATIGAAVLASTDPATGQVTLFAGDGDAQIDLFANGQIVFSGSSALTLLNNVNSVLEVGTDFISLKSLKLAFGAVEVAITPPVLPATPDAQDIADALVALGLVTQTP